MMMRLYFHNNERKSVHFLFILESVLGSLANQRGFWRFSATNAASGIETAREPTSALRIFPGAQSP